MLAFLIYLLKVCAWLTPLYILYLVLYKRFTFFSWNRYYLLFIVVLSFVLPFVQYDYVLNEVVIRNIIAPKATPTTFTESVAPSLAQLMHPTVIIENSDFEWWYSIIALYLIGAAFKSIQFITGLLGIQRLIHLSKRKWTNNLALIFTNDKVPHSSFFHYIFLNNKAGQNADTEKIIYHEMQHNEKLHTIDVLFCEVLKIILWFFPLVYWYKKSLQEIHEFEVDNEMTKLYNEVAYAELLVQVATDASPNATLLHPFSTKPLKARLKMIFNPKTYPMKKLAFLLVLPVIVTLLMAYGNVKVKTLTTIKTVQKPLTIVIDAGHGGSDAGAIYGTIKESDLTLILAKRLQQKAVEQGYTVIMTREADIAVPLKDRTAVTEANEVGLLVSLHVNIQNKGTDKNGIEWYSSTSTDATFKQASLDAGKKVITTLQQVNGIKVDATVKKRDAGIWVMKASNAPAILLELGYLSNEKDRNFITDNKQQVLVAEKIVEGINNYYKSY